MKYIPELEISIREIGAHGLGENLTKLWANFANFDKHNEVVYRDRLREWNAQLRYDPDFGTHFIVFKNKEDMTAFILRWS
jgi:abortive infection bacteriophage resistance protein